MATKQTFDCFDTFGDKIRRVGVASIKRVLRDLVNLTDESPEDWALVSCPAAGLYLSRLEKEYSITHVDLEGNILMDDDCKRDQGIALFLKIREAEKCEGNPEDG